MTFKFTFHLKSGKVFDTVIELTEEEFTSIVSTIKKSFREDSSGYILLGYCFVRLSECAVVDWEVLDEQKTEKSKGN